MFTLDNVPTCFYLSPMAQEVTNADGSKARHYFVGIVTAFKEGYNLTNWDYGSDYKLAEQAVASLNKKRGLTEEAVHLIQASSMWPDSRITLEDIYRANGEEVPFSVR